MTEVQAADVRAIVVETLAEQQRIRRRYRCSGSQGRRDDTELVWNRRRRSKRAALGFSASSALAQERRTGAERTPSRPVITVIVTGFVGAVWLGIKATLGK